MSSFRAAYDLSSKKSITEALAFRGKEQERLFRQARAVRDGVFHGRVEVRSVVEYSNICEQACKYCGMSSASGVERYTLRNKDVLRRVGSLYRKGRRVLMIQTGECTSERCFRGILSLTGEIKRRHRDLSLIGCFGTLDKKKYGELRKAGVERYILKFETSSPALYRKVKPTDTLKKRLAGIESLKRTGFKVSSGNILGLPGQTLESVAEDIFLLKKLDLPMGSTSVFIPNDMSVFANYPPGNIHTALNFTAILRLMCPDMLIPSTSSLETLIEEGQYLGLMAGANTVTLHDATPKRGEDRFIIYKKKRYIPKKSLIRVTGKAGLTRSPFPLLRDRKENSIFHRLVTGNSRVRRAAVICEDGKYSYKDILRMSSRFSSFLEKQKPEPGDRVALALYDSIEFTVSFLSCLRLGLTVCPVDPLMEKDEWKRTLKVIDPALVLSVPQAAGRSGNRRFRVITGETSNAPFLKILERQPESGTYITPDVNCPALILLTSGTTGEPRGAVHTFGDLFADTFPRKALGLTPEDRLFSFSRMHTSFGLGNSLLFPFLFGASAILLRDIPNPYSFKSVLKDRPTVMFAVPSIYELLARNADEMPENTEKLRLYISSGEKLHKDLFKKWKDIFGGPLTECYGTTEMCHPFVSNLPGSEKAGTCGKVLPPYEIRIGASGRIYYRGPTLSPGYYNDAASTDKRFRNGWFRSDDKGHIDKKGYLHFHGRKSLIIKSGGEWISLPGIEEKLRKCPVIKEAAAVRTRGGIEYHIVLEKGHGIKNPERSIRSFCSRKMKINELPRAIHFLSRLPRTRSGKVDRGALKKKP